MSEYTRTMGAPQASRDSTIPRFHIEAVPDPVASAAAGRPIFVSQERVQYINPGSSNSPVDIVTDEHRQRWPDYYAKFRAGEEFSVTGTPLEHWSFLRRTNVMELKAIGIFSVEQCADLPDTAVQRIGMGGDAIRKAAKAYLDDAAAMSIVSEAIAAREAAEVRLAAMEKKLAELTPLLESVHAENMMLKNAAPPSQTYVPGMHDPIQASLQAQTQPVATSSLDSLSAPKPRGRPPMNREVPHGA